MEETRKVDDIIDVSQELITRDQVIFFLVENPVIK